MSPVRIGDLDDVPILGGIESLEEVSARRQSLGANARDFDRHGEGDNSLTALLVGFCFRSHEKTEYAEAQCYSYSLEKFHFSPRVSPTNLHCGYDATSLCCRLHEKLHAGKSGRPGVNGVPIKGQSYAVATGIAGQY
jgi:hypothetical protein